MISSPEFDSTVLSLNYKFNSDGIEVKKVSSEEFLLLIDTLRKKKNVIIYVWASWCHFSFGGIKRANSLNNKSDTVIFLSGDIATKAQIKNIKNVAQFYSLASTLLIRDDFSLNNKLDSERVKRFLLPLTKKYDGGYPYYINFEGKRKREGYNIRDIKKS